MKWKWFVQFRFLNSVTGVCVCTRVYIPRTDRPGGKVGHSEGRCTPDQGWNLPDDTSNRSHTQCWSSVQTKVHMSVSGFTSDSKTRIKWSNQSEAGLGFQADGGDRWKGAIVIEELLTVKDRCSQGDADLHQAAHFPDSLTCSMVCTLVHTAHKQ